MPPPPPSRRWVGCKGCWGRGSDGGDGKDALLVANLRIIAIIVSCWRAWTATPVFSPAAALSGLAVPQSMSQPINRPISIMSSVWKFCSCAMKLLTAARSQSCWNRWSSRNTFKFLWFSRNCISTLTGANTLLPLFLHQLRILERKYLSDLFHCRLEQQNASVPLL